MSAADNSQRILVVGGGEGIGWEVTRTLLKHTPQVRVCTFGLSESEERHALPEESADRLHFIQGDVRSDEERRSVVDHCVRTMGGIDTLVFTAGVINPIQRIENLEMMFMRDTFDINVLGCMAMCQLVLEQLRWARIENQTNVGYSKAIILSSACDKEISYNGWAPYCITKAALTRFIEMLAHEEPFITVQGVYPKLTRTKMPEDVIAGKYKGIMADHEIERFRRWDEIGDEMVEPPEWCGEAVAKLALGLYAGGKSGETLDYDVHVPKAVKKKT